MKDFYVIVIAIDKRHNFEFDSICHEEKQTLFNLNIELPPQEEVLVISGYFGDNIEKKDYFSEFTLFLKTRMSSRKHISQ